MGLVRDRSMKVGDMVCKRQTGADAVIFAVPGDFGTGLVVGVIECCPSDFTSVTVWWPNYVHGSYLFEHLEMDLLPV